MDEKRRWRVIWHWTGKDGGPRCTLSDHASERAADAIGKARVADGATHYEVVDRAADGRSVMDGWEAAHDQQRNG